MTVVKWFRRKRGLALGLASCGASCGILVVPIVSLLIIEWANWRTGLLMFGVGLFVINSIAARFMVSEPAKLGLSVDGDAQAPGDAQEIGESSVATSWTLREAWATPSLWMLLVGFGLTMTTIGVPFVHGASFALDIGLSGLASAMAVSVIGLFALAGGIVLGVLSDRIGRKAAFVTAYALQVVAFILFLNAENETTLYLAAAAFGIFYGGFASLYPALVGDLFGPVHAGAIGGFIVAGGGILGSWGPALAGYFRDVHGNYAVSFYFCIVAASCALLVFTFLPKPQAC